MHCQNTTGQSSTAVTQDLNSERMPVILAGALEDRLVLARLSFREVDYYYAMTYDLAEWIHLRSRGYAWTCFEFHIPSTQLKYRGSSCSIFMAHRIRAFEDFAG